MFFSSSTTLSSDPADSRRISSTSFDSCALIMLKRSTSAVNVAKRDLTSLAPALSISASIIALLTAVSRLASADARSSSSAWRDATCRSASFARRAYPSPRYSADSSASTRADLRNSSSASCASIVDNRVSSVAWAPSSSCRSCDTSFREISSCSCIDSASSTWAVASLIRWKSYVSVHNSSSKHSSTHLFSLLLPGSLLIFQLCYRFLAGARRSFLLA